MHYFSIFRLLCSNLVSARFEAIVNMMTIFLQRLPEGIDLESFILFFLEMTHGMNHVWMNECLLQLSLFDNSICFYNWTKIRDGVIVLPKSLVSIHYLVILLYSAYFRMVIVKKWLPILLDWYVRIKTTVKINFDFGLFFIRIRFVFRYINGIIINLRNLSRSIWENPMLWKDVFFHDKWFKWMCGEQKKIYT